MVELNGNATNVANLKWCDSGGNDSNDYDDNIDGGLRVRSKIILFMECKLLKANIITLN